MKYFLKLRGNAALNFIKKSLMAKLFSLAVMVNRHEHRRN